MARTKQDTELIISTIKTEPRSINELSKTINKSWATTKKYVEEISQETGLINTKTFRQGTRGALLLAYYNNPDSLSTDALKKDLYERIKRGRHKHHFDFMDIYQFIPDNKKKSFLEHYKQEHLATQQRNEETFAIANNTVMIFSGNLSFLSVKENNKKLLDIFEELLTRGVNFKMLTRINVASIKNIHQLDPLMQKYPGQIEIRHCYQPLRGFIIDDNFARFKDEEQLQYYKEGELPENTRIFYDIQDKEWVVWLQKVFWNLFRTSLPYEERLREVENLF